MCQTRYKILCDTTVDEELWSDEAVSAIVWAQPESAAAQPTVDVIVSANHFSMKDIVCRALSRRMWRGRVHDAIDFDFVEPGVRIASNALQSPLVVVAAPASSCAEFCRRFDPVRLPVDELHEGSSPDPKALEKLADVNGVLESLRLHVPDWIEGEKFHPTQFFSLVRYSAKEFEEDQEAATSEARYAISCSPDWVLKHLCELNQKSILSGAVALVDARFNDVADLRLPENLKHRCTMLTSKEAFDKIYDKVQGAETVVFYCNHANNKSVARAKSYQEFLLASGHGNAKTQRVRVLDGGMGALVRLAFKRGGKPTLEKLFLSWDKSYTR